jgi:hypothetical protein
MSVDTRAGTPLIKDAVGDDLNIATSTKQNVTRQTQVGR